jgi:fatty-acyl-CoA synthase
LSGVASGASPSQLDRLSFEPLTPLLFLERSARVFGGRVAVVEGERRFTYAELRDRSLRLAGALRDLGIDPGDRVAVLAPNTALALEAHYAVPAAGAVLVALNYRLRPVELSEILVHSGARVLLCDAELEAVAVDTMSLMQDPVRTFVDSGAGGETEVLAASAEPFRRPVEDERSLISINYTSGTTGAPKGVMYHHRGAFLQAMAMAVHAKLDASSVSLWTLPMFHCNGWCFTWAVTAVGATHVCLRRVDSALIWCLIREHGVTHLNAAPTVLTMIATEPTADASGLRRRIQVGTGGAPPSPTLIASLDRLGMDITHLYGLTETFGPIMICEPQPEWEELDLERQVTLKARQGVGNVVAVSPRVVDRGGHDVPADGETLGEIAVRGNDVMLGYFRAPELSEAAAPDGWFRTGDLAVMHPDGYIEIRDRSKDMIISGGENIASVEVEHALCSHPAVLEAAVVAAPDDRWGEVPVAFVTLIEGHTAEPDELTAHVKAQIAGYKAPKRFIFGPLPKTTTGKIMKYELREQLWGAASPKRVH